jgi:hypothetical protein
VEAILQRYEKKNVFFIYILGGDEEMPDIDFKKHYRISCPVIPDNLDRDRHIIRVSGMVNVAIFGGDGVCVFNKSVMEEEGEGSFERTIDAALAKISGPNRKATAFIDGGTVYPPPLKEEGRIVRERMPALAAGPGGEMHLAYASDETGTSDIFLRSLIGGKWGNPVKVAATKADEYRPSVVAAGKGAAVVAYASNASGRYDIYTVIVKGGKAGKPVRVTTSGDDAMAPCLAPGENGGAWLAWYEWSKMDGLSRDREVFVVRTEGGGWSKPLQVSPREVPRYEDHADPVVASDGKGGAWVAWAWDYHGTLRKKIPMEENSIFLRHIDGGLKLGEIFGAGFRGPERARDYAPTLTVGPDGVPWVAWDNSHKSSLGYSAKAIFANRLQGADFPDQVEAAATKGRIDSPSLAVDQTGGVHLVWCQEAQGGWELWHRPIGPKEQGGARKLSVAAKSPRHSKACFDAKGKLWVAFTEAVGPKWQVKVEAIAP